MITLNNICVSFGEKKVLNELNACADSGDFIIILGTNGSGKSTLFDVIAGRIQPQHGSVIIDNTDVSTMSELRRASLVTRIFQNPSLNCAGHLTVHENLALAMYSRINVTFVNGMNTMPRTRAAAIIRSLGMNNEETVLDTPMERLSGGQRQLIAFAMATLNTPRILLLDEPTAALDPQAATHLLVHATRFISTHNITTFMITHDPHLALSIGTKIWILEHGIITKQFTHHEKRSIHPDDLIGQINYQALEQNV